MLKQMDVIRLTNQGIKGINRKHRKIRIQTDLSISNKTTKNEIENEKTTHHVTISLVASMLRSTIAIKQPLIIANGSKLKYQMIITRNHSANRNLHALVQHVLYLK